MFYVLLGLIIFCIFMSLRTLFQPYKIKGKIVSIENFLFLGTIYVTVMIGFALLYSLLHLNGHPVLGETGTVRPASDFIETIESSVYFSAMTLFSVGHGDIVPLGVGRAIAILEALIGYTIPAAFVAKAVSNMENKPPAVK
ncbi:ion channel [Neobacillus terrae]|uniref:ion channel n=1 Tax=Neobacillus terrae TaxID=3034837 RepID=UPI003B75CA67